MCARALRVQRSQPLHVTDPAIRYLPINLGRLMSRRNGRQSTSVRCNRGKDANRIGGEQRMEKVAPLRGSPRLKRGASGWPVEDSARRF